MAVLSEKNFENELPNGYRQVYYINAKDVKIGLIFNFIALVVLIIVEVISFNLLKLYDKPLSELIDYNPINLFYGSIVLLLSMIVYTILHELVHGIAYKTLTKEKLRFGLSWSCAFCGVPKIYTYRKTAIIAVIAPFAVFSIILLLLLAVLYFLSPLYYLIISFIFGLHLGGCSGDLYVLYLFLVKFKNKNTLMKDTGPEQFFYIKED